MIDLAVTSRPAAPWKGSLRAIGAAILATSLAWASPAAHAQSGSIPVVRDAEVEALLADYLRPILKVAGVPKPLILLVPSQQFNAFVTGRGNMFVNVGAVIMTETPNELIGVLAHETGHMANNDMARLTQQMEDTKRAMLLAGLVGIGAAAAGAATGSSEASQAGAGVLSGAMGMGQMSLLRFRREQESAADRSAIKYLSATGQSGAGMLATMQRLADQSLLSSQGANPFLLSHPLPRERVTEIQSLIAGSKYTNAKDPPALQLRHDLARAKLIGFTWPGTRVNQRYPISDNSLPARYARAIVAYRTGNPAMAQKLIDDLIKAAPKNPYFQELKGQAYLETGNAAAAVAPLRRAVALAPNANIIKVLLAQALVAGNTVGNADEVIKLLTVALQAEPELSIGYRALARAYAAKDNIPMAQLATAQGLLIDGNYKEAKAQAMRAQAKLKAGSPAWLRADDIVSYKPPKK